MEVFEDLEVIDFFGFKILLALFLGVSFGTRCKFFNIAVDLDAVSVTIVDQMLPVFQIVCCAQVVGLADLEVGFRKVAEEFSQEVLARASELEKHREIEHVIAQGDPKVDASAQYTFLDLAKVSERKGFNGDQVIQLFAFGPVRDDADGEARRSR